MIDSRTSRCGPSTPSRSRWRCRTRASTGRAPPPASRGMYIGLKRPYATAICSTTIHIYLPPKGSCSTSGGPGGPGSRSSTRRRTPSTSIRRYAPTQKHLIGAARGTTTNTTQHRIRTGQPPQPGACRADPGAPGLPQPGGASARVPQRPLRGLPRPRRRHRRGARRRAAEIAQRQLQLPAEGRGPGPGYVLTAAARLAGAGAERQLHLLRR